MYQESNGSGRAMGSIAGAASQAKDRAHSEAQQSLAGAHSVLALGNEVLDKLGQLRSRLFGHDGQVRPELPKNGNVPTPVLPFFSELGQTQGEAANTLQEANRILSDTLERVR